MVLPHTNPNLRNNLLEKLGKNDLKSSQLTENKDYDHFISKILLKEIEFQNLLRSSDITLENALMSISGQNSFTIPDFKM